MRCIAVALLFPPLAMGQEAATTDVHPQFVRGDVDANAHFDLTDALVLLQYLFLEGPSPPCHKSADTGDDGGIDIGDAIQILYFLFAWSDPSPPFPAPFPGCGEDPTADVLACENYSPCGTPRTKTSTLGIELIYVPPGKFLMGSTPGERGRQSDEEQHEVTLTCGFYLGKYEITREQYKQVMGYFPLLPPDFEQATGGADVPNTPVFSVSWDQTMQFCRKLSALENSDYTLPTEAQWEYACRAGTPNRFSFGDALDCTDWCGAQPASCKIWDYMWQCYPVKKPVNGKLPNPSGFYGMHSNVGEWCRDWYAPYPRNSVVDPAGPRTGSEKVVRAPEGGSEAVLWCRSAARLSSQPHGSGQNIGFRVVQRIPCESLEPTH